MPTVNDGLIFSTTIDEAYTQEAITVAQESTAVADIEEEEGRLLRLSMRRKAYAARVLVRQTASLNESQGPVDLASQEASLFRALVIRLSC